MEKLKKISKVMNVVFKLILLFTVVEFIEVLIKLGINQAALLLENPGADMIRVSGMDFGNFNVRFVNEQNMGTKLLIAEIMIKFFSAVFNLVVNVFTISMFGKLLRPMTQGQPYDGTISRTLKKFGVGYIMIGIGQNVISYLMLRTSIYRFVEFLNAFPTDTVSSINGQISFSFAFIFTGALILVFSLVFQYGEELQVQADETL